jgi:hypothetical protein
MRTPTRTLYPELLDNNITNSLDFLKEYTSYLENIGGNSNEDLTDKAQIVIDFYNAKKTGDTIENISTFFNNLDKNKFKNLNLDYVYFWVKKYHTLPDIIKSKINLNKNSYYNEISDSIGILANITNKMSDNTGPVWDFNFTNFGIPQPYSNEMQNKLSNNTKEISYDLQRKNTSLMRNNLKGLLLQTTKLDKQIQQVAADPTQSHSTNLITDFKFFQDFFSSLQSMVDNLKGSFSSDYYEFLSYFSVINDKKGYNPRASENLQFIYNLFFEIDIEGKRQKVDLLQKKLKNSMSSRTNKNAISVERLNSSNVMYNTDSINQNYLGVRNEFKIPIPISIENSNFINQNSSFMQIPNNALSKINDAFEKIGPNNIPGFSAALNNQISNTLNTFGLGSLDPTSNINSLSNLVLGPLGNSLSEFTSLVTNPFSILSDSIKITGSSGIPSILPFEDLGSFPEIASLVTQTNLNQLDPTSVLSLVESIKNIVCNFKLPIIGKIDFSEFFTVGLDGKALLAKLKSMIPKFPKKDDFVRFMKDLIPDFKSIFKNIYKKLFECD